MTVTHRESKIIAAVSCPTCHAPIGQPCRVVRGRPMVCTTRKAAWQQQRDAQPLDYVLTPHHEGPPSQRTAYMLVAPQSAEAATALIALTRTGAVREWEWIGGALRVPHAAMRVLSQRLIRAGWRTGDQI